MSLDAHLEAIAANQERVKLKAKIDEATHAPYSEIKSYYFEAATEQAAE